MIIFIMCNNKNTLHDSNVERINKIEDSLNYRKQKLKKKIEEKRLANEKKYDSLKIKGDSAKNKSNLSDFLENTPIYNKIKEK